jgi:hypothetical protein
MYYQLIILGLACLIAPWLATLAGYELKHKPFALVGVGGMFFLLATSFGLGMNLVDVLHTAGRALMIISFVLGWIALGIGAIWGAADVLVHAGHELVRPAKV